MHLQSNSLFSRWLHFVVYSLRAIFFSLQPKIVCGSLIGSVDPCKGQKEEKKVTGSALRWDDGGLLKALETKGSLHLSWVLEKKNLPNEFSCQEYMAFTKFLSLGTKNVEVPIPLVMVDSWVAEILLCNRSSPVACIILRTSNGNAPLFRVAYIIRKT